MKQTLRRAACLLCAAVFVMVLTACGKEKTAPVKTDAAVGEALSTLFFDLKVNTAQRVENYNEYAPQEEDTALVLVNVTVTNTTESSITMYDSDFTLTYGTGAEDYAWIFDAFVDAMQPAEDALEPGASRTYDLLFPVPKASTAFALHYTENYQGDDGAAVAGNTYTVSFTA